MTLAGEISKFQNEMAGKIPEDILHLFAQKTEELIKSNIAENALNKGDKIPSFSLPNVQGEIVSSDQLLKKGSLVVSFYRGSWCPYCNLELRAIQQVLPQIQEAGAQLIAISPELPDKSLSVIEKHALKFEVLSDLENKVAKEFGIVFSVAEELRPIYTEFGFHLPDFNGDESYELPFPATYVVDKDGIIIYAFVNADYTKRAEPTDLINALKQTEHAR